MGAWFGASPTGRRSAVAAASAAPVVAVAPADVPAAPVARSNGRPAGPIGWSRTEAFWLTGAILLSLLFSARTMAPAFTSADTIQDDALQHVFWMLRFRDPELFPGDLFADYFQTVAPPGYAALYWVLARVIDPLLASKVLPPLLGLVAALFTFNFVRLGYPRPQAAFLATILSSWYVWQHTDLASATPRAFLLPILAALLWALATGRLVLGVALSGLGAVLYPTAGALCVALLVVRLVSFEGRKPRLTRDRSAWLAAAAAAALVAALLLPGELAGSPFGPTVTAEQARAMPEFGPKARNAFFVDAPTQFWLTSHRSGLNFRIDDAVFRQIPILAGYVALAMLLPLLLALRRRVSGPRPVARHIWLLLQLLAASFALFFLAHALLFRLYLPTRFVQWSLPLVLSISAGLGLAILFEAIAARLRPADRRPLAAGLALLFGAGLALYPAPYQGLFYADPHPRITAYLRTQPNDVLVAAAPGDAALIPSLAGRRILVAREYALAYHLGYYGEVRQRLDELLEAYYDEGNRRLSRLVDRYGVDFFLVDNAAFQVVGFQKAWGSEFEPFTSAVAARLNRPRRYGLQDLVQQCAVADDGRLALVPASCLDRRR